ncbi:unnamed protein product [Paramecium pentaurelia]|uniref:Uncharacterized protein n=1 Tax=Paramecium pentaurelia TaxID=43138 RepID=A0A8S1WVA9_9CILI|nr:unnamed protein product [Paramecium pentaurelia]
MNELQFLQYRYQLRIREQKSAKDLWLSTYCCFLYMLLKAFNITGKMAMMQIYDFIYSTNFPLDPDPGLVSFGNIQWFCYEMAAPFSLPMIPLLLQKVQFRYIFFFSSFGSILFILPLQFATICKDSDESICNIYVMWTFTIVFSFVSGFCKTLLLFSMLYYLSNLAGGREKIIYYSSFYFIHQFQWLIGSLIGNLLVDFCSRGSLLETLKHVYIILIISSLFLCSLFLTIPDEKKKSKFKKFNKMITQLLIQNGKENQKILRLELQKMNQKNESNQLYNKLIDLEEDTDERKKIQQIMDTQVQMMQTQQFFTIQSFSYEENNLQDILSEKPKSSDDLHWVYASQKTISIEEYVKNNYFGNLYLTLSVLCLDGFYYFIILIFNVGSMLSFLLLQLPNLLTINSVQDPEVRAATVYEGFLYVGIGQIFGCFYMGLFGDFSQKITGLYYILGVYQLGCFLAWGIYIYQIDFLVFVMSFILGFSCSAMMSTTISFQIVYFHKFIYSVDLMYIIFSFSFSITSLLYIITNFFGKFNGLILLQSSGILGLLSIWRIHMKLKAKLNKQQ